MWVKFIRWINFLEVVKIGDTTNVIHKIVIQALLGSSRTKVNFN